MSENKNEIVLPPFGFTAKDMEALAQYQNDGLPGIAKVSVDDLFRSKTFYLEGLSFSEISVKTRIPKKIIIYTAHKENWPEQRKEKIESLLQSLSERQDITKVSSASVILDIVSSFEAYFQKKTDLFRRTGDETVLESTDFKMLDRYLKCLETVFGKNSKDDKPNSPLVGITVENGANVSVKGNADSAEDLGKVLKTLADLNRSKENK